MDVLSFNYAKVKRIRQINKSPKLRISYELEEFPIFQVEIGLIPQ